MGVEEVSTCFLDGSTPGARRLTSRIFILETERSPQEQEGQQTVRSTSSKDKGRRTRVTCKMNKTTVSPGAAEEGRSSRRSGKAKRTDEVLVLVACPDGAPDQTDEAPDEDRSSEGLAVHARDGVHRSRVVGGRGSIVAG